MTRSTKKSKLKRAIKRASYKENWEEVLLLKSLMRENEPKKDLDNPYFIDSYCSRWYGWNTPLLLNPIGIVAVKIQA